jgi:uncharacterized membrane protein
MLFGPLFLTGLVAACVVLIAGMLRSLRRTGEFADLNLRTSRDALDEHLARGEIDRNEYVERSRPFDLGAATL